MHPLHNRTHRGSLAYLDAEQPLDDVSAASQHMTPSPPTRI
jgi:hypothetical protein